MAKTVSGEDQGDERKRTIDEVSKYQRLASKLGCLQVSRISSGGNLFTA